MFDLNNMPRVGYKMRLRKETCEQVHMALFSMGLKRSNGTTDVNTDAKFLYIDYRYENNLNDDSKYILYDQGEPYFNADDGVEIFESDLLFTELYNEKEVEEFKKEIMKYE